MKSNLVMIPILINYLELDPFCANFIVNIFVGNMLPSVLYVEKVSSQDR
jgi:hypothetical protein